MQYVGESEISLQDRFSEHVGYVKNKHLTKATGGHYNLPGHTISDMRVTIVETSLDWAVPSSDQLKLAWAWMNLAKTWPSSAPAYFLILLIFLPIFSFMIVKFSDEIESLEKKINQSKTFYSIIK